MSSITVSTMHTVVSAVPTDISWGPAHDLSSALANVLMAMKNEWRPSPSYRF